MAEFQDLIGVYGEVDRAVAANPERRAAVAKILPAYADGRAVGWFDEFEAWTLAQRPPTSSAQAPPPSSAQPPPTSSAQPPPTSSARRPTKAAQPPFPELADALNRLGEIEARGRMRARRLFAIAIAARAFPAIGSPHSDLAGLARRALNFGGGTVDTDAAQQLLALLADDALLDADDQGGGDLDKWWEELLNAPAAQELLLDDPAHIGPRPCSGQLVMVDVLGETVPVATLRSTFETSAITFAQALRYLDPQNWPHCCGLWCKMDPVAGAVPPPALGVRRFHEKVSANCKHEDETWTVSAELDFRLTEIPGLVAIAEYQLSPGHPLPHDDVLVDEGSLVVHEIGTQVAPKIRVTTTKRVRFNHAFSGEALSIIMCALGYAAIVEDVVFTCALQGAQPSTPFKGAPPATKPASHEPSLGPAITAIAGETATSVKDCIDDYGKMAAASSQRMADGCYGADELVQDLSGAWTRMVRDGAKALDLGAGGARRVADASRRDRQETKL